MNRARHHQRYTAPIGVPFPTRSSPLRNALRRPVRVSRQAPVQTRERRIIPIPDSLSQQANNKDIQRDMNPEVEFDLACKRFFREITQLQIIALAFFLLLLICTQIWQNMLNVAFICYRVIVGVYILFLVKSIFMTQNMNKEKPKMIYRLVEAILFLFSLSSNDEERDRVTLIVLFSILLTSYFLRTIYSYKINKSEQSDFGNSINRTVFLLRTLILLQGILVLVQLSLESPITWFAVVVPTWIVTLIILVFTINLIKLIYFTYKTQFWKSDIDQKKRAAKWMFGNLFTLLLLLLCISLLIAFVFDGYISEDNRPFLAPFVILVLWCIISLIDAKRVQVDLLKFSQDLRIIVDADLKRERQRIKYVIKISNTYFKPATEQDIKQRGSYKVASEDVEIETGLTGRSGEINSCMVCCKSASDGVFMGCGHGGICFECGKDIMKVRKECHMCREKIKSLLKMDTKKTKAVYCKITGEIINENEYINNL